MRGPSLKSVAKAAGVSVSSVSNAYNKPEQLSAKMRDRILRIAHDQGYAGPDAAARSLRSRHAGAIGMLFTEQLSYAFSDPYAVGLLAGLAEIAEQTRTGLLLIPVVPNDATDPEAIETSVQAVRQAVVDGIVAYCIDPDHPASDVIRSRRLPIVGTNDVAEFTHHVLIDEVGATRSLGEHLRKLGHRHVGAILTSHTHGDTLTVSDADDIDLMDFEQQRLRGFREGLGPDARIIAVTGGHNSIESGRAAAAELLDRSNRPTALMATSDVMALGALQALEQRGLTPGRDISVTGFDDIPAAAGSGLTTVRQQIAERGRIMGRMLLDPDYTETRVVLPTDVVVRASTGPAPTST
jgi:DNA-binding LacI/PurR family transcriptional regulator